ncbi:MAG: aminoglycoside phosphotransferase family protein [Verrucomicrobiales bacterium]|nr:aminoglycoside phosphotransferase family protein [Verrucomicrobiales bacterium]
MKGVQLDIENPIALTAWLRGEGRIGHDEAPQIQVLAGGVSNRTVRVLRSSGECWVLKQALEQLRVPTEWRSSPMRVHREALGMQWLARLVPAGAVPEFVFEDEQVHVVAMRAVPDPHVNWKTTLLTGSVEDWAVAEFARLLAAIHDGSASDPMRAVLRMAFRDKSFFEGLRLEPFYEFTAARVPLAASFLHTLASETRRCETALVHGDYSPKNILVHRRSLVLVDHEVIHWGDPMFDVGFAMAHLLCKATHLAHHREAFLHAIQRFWNEYAACVGPTFRNELCQSRAVRHALACALARVAGRSQVEYLNEQQKAIQRTWICHQFQEVPTSWGALVTSFRALVPAIEGTARLDHTVGSQ